MIGKMLGRIVGRTAVVVAAALLLCGEAFGTGDTPIGGLRLTSSADGGHYNFTNLNGVVANSVVATNIYATNIYAGTLVVTNISASNMYTKSEVDAKLVNSNNWNAAYSWVSGNSNNVPYLDWTNNFTGSTNSFRNVSINGDVHVNGDAFIARSLYVTNIYTTNLHVTLTNLSVQTVEAYTGKFTYVTLGGVSRSTWPTDAAFSNITGSAYDNVSLSNSLVAKQNVIAGTVVTNGSSPTFANLTITNSLALGTNTLTSAGAINATSMVLADELLPGFESYAQMRGGAFQLGYGFDSSHYTRGAWGVLQLGWINPGASNMVATSVNGAVQLLSLSTGTTNILINSDSTMQAITSQGAGSPSTFIIGNAYGGCQLGYADGARIEQSFTRGCLQLVGLSTGQTSYMGSVAGPYINASIGMGAVTVSHSQALVAGDGQVSHGDGSISASGGFYDNGIRVPTNVDLTGYIKASTANTFTATQTFPSITISNLAAGTMSVANQDGLAKGSSQWGAQTSYAPIITNTSYGAVQRGSFNGRLNLIDTSAGAEQAGDFSAGTNRIYSSKGSMQRMLTGSNNKLYTDIYGGAGCVQLGLNEYVSGVGGSLIASNVYGSVQAGCNYGSVINKGAYGTLQLYYLWPGQVSTIADTASGSIVLGAGSATHSNSITMGDGAISYAKGSVSATGGFYDNGVKVLTNINYVSNPTFVPNQLPGYTWTNVDFVFDGVNRSIPLPSWIPTGTTYIVVSMYGSAGSASKYALLYDKNTNNNVGVITQVGGVTFPALGQRLPTLGAMTLVYYVDFNATSNLQVKINGYGY